MESDQAGNSTHNHTAALAKITDTPEGQRIELPAGLRIKSHRFYVRQSGDVILLIPEDNPWASLVDSLDQFSDDFMVDRCQPMQRAREDI